MTSPSAEPRASASRRAKTALDSTPVARQELLMALFRANEALSLVYSRFFQAHGVTLQQFNVLRVLYVRDHDESGLSCQEVGRRLINRVPDVTRLIDRLERAGLVERVRCTSDRRVVRLRLSKRGHDLVESTHPAVMALHGEVTAHLDDREVATLTELLVKYQRHGLAAEIENSDAIPFEDGPTQASGGDHGDGARPR